MNTNLQRIILFICIGYFIVVLCNLAFVPIAWIDEIMDLDPAMRWVEGQGYNSFLWQYNGSEHIFLANLPLRNLPFAAMGYLFGADIFWMRFPHILFFMGTCILFYKLTKHYANEGLAWIILLFFMFDKGIYESLRSVRCEMQQLFYLSAALYFTLVRRNGIIAIVSCSLLALVHPASWMLSIVIAVKNLLTVKRVRNKILLGVLYLAPFVVWLWLIDFNFMGIFDQLIAAGEDHTENGSGITLLLHHFYNRFSLYLTTQPWVWLGILFAHILAIKNLIRNKDFISLLLLAHSLFWMFVLAPNYRYNPTMLLLSYLIMARFFAKYEWKAQWQKAIIVFVLFVQSIPFVSINLMGMMQYNERNPYKFQEWLSQQVNISGKTLLCGESVGLYWIHNIDAVERKVEFCAPNYPHKFDFSSYNKIILLSAEKLPLHAFAEYKPKKTCNAMDNLFKKFNSPTYNGMKLYEVSPDELTNYCLQIRHGDKW